MTDSLTLPVMTAGWSEDKAACFQLVPRKDPVRSELAEKDYDAWVIRHANSIAGALRAARVLGASCELVLLGTQIRNTDVLFAEVEKGPDGQEHMSRLVIFENKLLKNPEQRRQVIAQILDYARELTSAAQDADDIEALMASMKAVEKTWLEAHRADILRVLRRRKLLHVICGDELDTRLVGLAQHAFGLDDDPLEQQDAALLALELYRNERQEYLLVPRVLPIVEGAQRSLELTVVVKDSSRAEVDATVVVTKQSSTVGTAAGDEDSFFKKFEGSVATDLREVIQRVRAVGIPGLTEDHMRSGQPTFAVNGQNILTVSPGEGGIVDHIQPATVKLEEGTPLGDALARFRSRLTAIPGATQRLSGRVVVPAALARQHVEAIVAALKEFGESPAAKA